MNRDLANDFVSCRQYLNGSHQYDSLDNDQLRALVLDKAVKHSQEHGLLKVLKEISDHSRLNGALVNIEIKTGVWEELVVLLGRVKRWGKVDEEDLLEHCLKCYMSEMKLKKGLP
jgi:hypothetical protein